MVKGMVEQITLGNDIPVGYKIKIKYWISCQFIWFCREKIVSLQKAKVFLQ